jgi:predicted RNA polymerase sigma factor
VTLIRVTGDWNLAEECAQDAFALALEHWRRDGIPRRPGAWLTTPSRHGPARADDGAAAGAGQTEGTPVVPSG